MFVPGYNKGYDIPVEVRVNLDGETGLNITGVVRIAVDDSSTVHIWQVNDNYTHIKNYVQIEVGVFNDE
jgi:hypothetical protein